MIVGRTCGIYIWHAWHCLGVGKNFVPKWHNFPQTKTKTNLPNNIGMVIANIYQSSLGSVILKLNTIHYTNEMLIV